MAFNRVIPSQHLLPAQVRSVALREIRPPYNSELGSEVGTFYLVRFSPTHLSFHPHLITPEWLEVTFRSWPDA